MPDNKEKTAEIVKNCRLARGYTQLQLAELTRISLRSIQRIEAGKVIPRSYTLQVLATQLGFNPGDVITVEPGTAARTRAKSNPKKIILSAGVAVMLLLFGAAFLSQSARFPETSFEYFLFWGFVAALYCIILLKIWK